jgi:glycosyltransferase involved in cell wall biosynthesis
MELVEYSSFLSRQDVINFYQSVDVQIVWRPYYRRMKIRMSNPLKLVNAASFGVPTIAFDEPAFSEMNGTYIPVKTVEEFLHQLQILKESNTLYQEYSERCLKKAELYHISHIGRLYLDLV